MESSESELDDFLNWRPRHHRLALGISLHLTATFNLSKDNVEFSNGGGLEHPKNISGKVMSDVVAVRTGRVMQQSNSNVQSANDGVNVFTFVVTDLEMFHLLQD